MNVAMIDRIVNAVLYEGYILYPYRRSIKNHRRWTFGGIYPRDYCLADDPSERWSIQIECLIRGDENTQLEIETRFLHLVERRIARAAGQRQRADTRDGPEPEAVWEFLDALEINGIVHHPWQEAVERRVQADTVSLAAIMNQPRHFEFRFPAQRKVELLTAA
ncbi:MAG: hypothetical protein JWM11_2261 [Planctomycetaceae bacterium]|nr:hypothetical protein [Planctomycetaceae bacterium]